MSDAGLRSSVTASGDSLPNEKFRRRTKPPALTYGNLKHFNMLDYIVYITGLRDLMKHSCNAKVI